MQQVDTGTRPAKRQNRHEPHPALNIEGDQRLNNIRLTCPYCGHFSRIRNSEWISESLVKGTVECMNDACEWSGHYDLQITETTRPCRLKGSDKAALGIPYSPFLAAKLAQKEKRTGTADLLGSGSEISADTTLH